MNSFKKIILNNGIPLYLCVDPSMKRTFVSYSVKYGSSGEWFNFNNNGKDYSVITGHAHYIEHLLGEHGMFGSMFNNFDERFQRCNAYTGMNETSYHFNGREDVEKSIEELILTIDNPIFDNNDVEATRHAIEEESASCIDDASSVLTSLLGRNLYNGFELYDSTLSTIGNRETTKQITTEGLYDCYNAFYSDDKKFVVIAGNVNEERIVDLLNNIYAKSKPHQSNLVLPELDYETIRSKDEVVNLDVDVPKVGIGMKFKKTPSLSLNELYYCLYLIRNSLFDSDKFRKLQKNGVYDLLDFGYIMNVNDYMNYYLGFVSKNKEELVKNVLDLLNNLEISKKEYELAQKGLIADEMRSLDRKYSHLQYFPMDIAKSEDLSQCDFYKSVDYDRFMEMKSSLDFSNYTVGEIKRLNKTR